MGRRAVVVGGVAALLVLVLWWLLLWSPQRSDIADAKDRRETAEQQVSQLRVTLSRLQELKRSEALKRSQIEALRVAVPDQPNLAQFILDANEAADRAGIDFLSVTPAVPAAGTGNAPASINLAMSITGGYFQVLDFVNRLTDLPRVVVIDNLSLNAGEGGTMSVSITARMFSATAPPAAGGTAGPTTTTPAAAPTTTAVTGGATTTTGAP
jgi:type IV pilus assembly protein PilO